MSQALVFCFRNANATGALGATADRCSHGGYWGELECRPERRSGAPVGYAADLKTLEGGALTRTLRRS